MAFLRNLAFSVAIFCLGLNSANAACSAADLDYVWIMNFKAIGAPVKGSCALDLRPDAQSVGLCRNYYYKEDFTLVSLTRSVQPNCSMKISAITDKGAKIVMNGRINGGSASGRITSTYKGKSSPGRFSMNKSN